MKTSYEIPVNFVYAARQNLKKKRSVQVSMLWNKKIGETKYIAINTFRVQQDMK